MSNPPEPNAEPAWHALFDAALVARPEVTAAIDAAVSGALADHGTTPSEACLGLAHALAAQACRSPDPTALLGAAFHLASMLTSASRPANDRR